MKCEFNALKKAKKKKEEEYSSVNSAANDDLDDALVLCVDSPIESWVLDSGEYGKIYLTDGKPLDIMGKDDVHIKYGNGC